MRVLTSDVPKPGSGLPVATSSRIRSPEHIQRIYDEVFDTIVGVAKTKAREAWLRNGRPLADFERVFSDEGIAASDTNGCRARQYPMTLSVSGLMTAANPGRTDVPPLTVERVQSNAVNAVAEILRMTASMQGSGQWFVLDIAREAGATRKVARQDIGTGLDTVEGVGAQRAIAPGSNIGAIGEKVTADRIVPEEEEVLRYIVTVIDVTGREDTDHAGRPIIKVNVQQPAANNDAINRLADILGARQPAQADLDAATRAVLEQLPADLRTKVGQVLAKKA